MSAEVKPLSNSPPTRCPLPAGRSAQEAPSAQPRSAAVPDTVPTKADGVPRSQAALSHKANRDFTASLLKSFPKGQNYRDAIRRKCLDCCCGDRSEVARCEITSCALWPFRFGSNPFRGTRNHEQSEAQLEIECSAAAGE